MALSRQLVPWLATIAFAMGARLSTGRLARAARPAAAAGRTEVGAARPEAPAGMGAPPDTPMIVVDAGAWTPPARPASPARRPAAPTAERSATAAGGSLDCGACPTGYTCKRDLHRRRELPGDRLRRQLLRQHRRRLRADAGLRRLLGEQTCNARASASPPAACRSTCNPGTARFCGKIGDGCGGTLDCGNCPAPRPAAGAASPASASIRTASRSPARRRAAPVLRDIGDGCGGMLDCGNCSTRHDLRRRRAGRHGPNVCPGPAAGLHGLAVPGRDLHGDGDDRVSGTVYDPAGKVPLYNVTVYVPNAALDPIPEGASCDKCSAQLSGNPIAAALTDANGRFQLDNVPSGPNIPLVIQVGKWRRQVTHPDRHLLRRQPDHRREPDAPAATQAEGHIPKIALTTGGSDALECLLREIGIADTEFTTDTGTGRVNLYVGGTAGRVEQPGTDRFAAALGGAMFPNATTLWGKHDQAARLRHPHALVRGEPVRRRQEAVHRQHQELRRFGRAPLQRHLHFYWLRRARRPGRRTASLHRRHAGGATIRRTLRPPPSTPPSPRARRWPTGWSRDRRDDDARPDRSSTTAHSVAEVNAAHAALDLHADESELTASPSGSAQYMTFNTPVEATADKQCGRVVVTDIHVKAAPPAAGESKDKSDPGRRTPFPTGCTSVTLRAQDKALEFLFFDLSACVQPDTTSPCRRSCRRRARRRRRRRRRRPPPVPPPPPPPPPPPVQ